MVKELKKPLQKNSCSKVFNGKKIIASPRRKHPRTLIKKVDKDTDPCSLVVMIWEDKKRHIAPIKPPTPMYTKISTNRILFLLVF